MADPSEKQKLYKEADRILMEEAAIVPLTYLRHHALIKPWVEPVSAMQEGLWKDVTLRPH